MTRLRIDDIVEHIKRPGRVGVIRELFHSGRVSVVWPRPGLDGGVRGGPASEYSQTEYFRNRFKTHYAAKNLRVVKP